VFGGGVLEGDGDAVRLLVDRADGVLEHVGDLVAGGLIEGRSELAAHDLDVPARDPRHQPTHVDIDTPAVVTLKRDHLGPGAGLYHCRKHAGPLGHVHRRPEQINGVTAGPHPGQRHPFDHRDRASLPAKPVGRRRARDAGAGDQDTQRLPSHVATHANRWRVAALGREPAG
jgi:hypothetical protein